MNFELSDEDTFECCVCLELAIHTYSCIGEKCGKLLCGKCAMLNKKKDKGRCPCCRREKTIMPNPAQERLINRIKVPCTKKCG